jgi:hypothetical protein
MKEGISFPSKDVCWKCSYQFICILLARSEVTQPQRTVSREVKAMYLAKNPGFCDRGRRENDDGRKTDGPILQDVYFLGGYPVLSHSFSSTLANATLLIFVCIGSISGHGFLFHFLFFSLYSRTTLLCSELLF